MCVCVCVCVCVYAFACFCVCVCVCGPVSLRRFKGFKPSILSALVFLGIPRAGDDYWHEYCETTAYQIALQGFLAASVENDSESDAYPDDAYDLSAKADNIFRGSGSTLGVLCAMSEAYRSREVAVAGHSQGGRIAMFPVKLMDESLRTCLLQ